MQGCIAFSKEEAKQLFPAWNFEAFDIFYRLQDSAEKYAVIGFNTATNEYKVIASEGFDEWDAEITVSTLIARHLSLLDEDETSEQRKKRLTLLYNTQPDMQAVTRFRFGLKIVICILALFFIAVTVLVYAYIRGLILR